MVSNRAWVSKGLSAAVLAVTVGTACTTPAGGAPGASPQDSVAPAAASVPAELARFYQQKLSWGGCTPGTNPAAQCTSFEVPIDYAKPDAGSVTLKMLRLPAHGGKASRGALFVNPGGPGGSAMQYAAYGDAAFSAQLRRNFDIVGFDPRGVGESNPMVCVGAETMDALLGFDPTPDDPAERAGLNQIARQFGDACKAKYPELIGHVSTEEAARDMDVARALLGQPKLMYLGKSWGTFLGASYAGQFPTHVGRMVLDGAVPPDLTDVDLNLGQAEGFEAATRAYVADCVAEANCPLGRDVDAGMKKLGDFITQLDAKPLPVRGDARVTKLTEGWGSTALAEAMYDQGMWGFLTPALRDAFAGDGTRLFEFSKQYARRNEKGVYTENIMQVINAVNCLDRGTLVRTEEQRAKLVKEFTAKAPTWGRLMANGSVTCESWPVPKSGRVAPVKAEGSPPIVVIGTTRDPATPYRWSQQLAEQLANGRLISFDGDGHTAYMRSNNCVDKAVDAYLIDGKVPEQNLRC